LTDHPQMIQHFDEFPKDDEGNLDLSDYQDAPAGLTADNVYKKGGKYYSKDAAGKEIKVTKKQLAETNINEADIKEVTE
jgi:hypothetical protein